MPRKALRKDIPIDQQFDLPPWTEEEVDAHQAMHEAWDRGDDDAALEHAKKIRFTPGSLLATKKNFGANHIRKMGFNTELADRFLGPDWLDRDDI